MNGKIGFIFIIIALLISCSVLASATSESKLTEDQDESSNPKLLRVAHVKRAFAEGNASSGKTFGPSGRIGIIKFDSVRFSKLKLFPIRWEMADFYDATAIVFGIDQEIPEGPFEFQRDWVSAIVFY